MTSTGRIALLAAGLTVFLPLQATGGGGFGSAASAPPEAPLPAGVRAVWDLGKAHREETATRGRVCLNGLWRWQPAATPTDSVPCLGKAEGSKTSTPSASPNSAPTCRASSVSIGR